MAGPISVNGLAASDAGRSDPSYFLFAIQAEPSTVTSTIRPPPMKEPQPDFALSTAPETASAAFSAAS